MLIYFHDFFWKKNFWIKGLCLQRNKMKIVTPFEVHSMDNSVDRSNDEKHKHLFHRDLMNCFLSSSIFKQSKIYINNKFLYVHNALILFQEWLKIRRLPQRCNVVAQRAYSTITCIQSMQLIETGSKKWTWFVKMEHHAYMNGD